jgi:HEAT repeat protein
MIPVLLLIFTFYVAMIPENALASAPKTLISITDAAFEDNFDRIFREGKDFIDQEEWKKAAEKFKELIDKYPKNKSTDAVLYWLAFSYKKQKAFKQTEETLDRLLTEFPASLWVTDAKVMKIEVVPVTKTLPKEAKPARRGATPVTKVHSEITIINIPQDDHGSGAEMRSSLSKLSLDREDEIRFAAFQSLLSADLKQAVETISYLLLSPDSKASETLKVTALRALTRERLLRPERLTDSLRKLSDILTKSFQAESNFKIQEEIIYSLANLYDEWSTRYVTGIYASGNKRVKKAIIDSFSDPSRNLFVVFGSRRISLIHQIESEKLLEILRTETETELRRLAFDKLRRIRTGNPNSGGSITADNLIQWYEAETDEELKILFIRTLKDIKQTPAAKKLLDIAKNDKSDKLRLEAIYWLRSSKDPEVIKALAEMIK